MTEALVAGYLWCKAAHVVSVIAWMAGMLYLPRLFVYHCGADAGTDAARMLETMERRLLRAIVTPAMAASLFFGGLLAATPGAVDWSAWWVHAKASLLVCLLLLHAALAGWRRRFARGRNRRPAGFYRAVNETVTLLMAAVVVLAVVKPG